MLINSFLLIELELEFSSLFIIDVDVRETFEVSLTLALETELLGKIVFFTEGSSSSIIAKVLLSIACLAMFICGLEVLELSHFDCHTHVEMSNKQSKRLTFRPFFCKKDAF